MALALNAHGLKLCLLKRVASIQFLRAITVRVKTLLLGGFQLRRDVSTTLLQRCHLIGQANKLLAQFVVLLKRHGAAQATAAIFKQLKFFRLLRLAAHNAQAALHANQLLTHRDKMALRKIQLARGLMLARTKARHARGLL